MVERILIACLVSICIAASAPALAADQPAAGEKRSVPVAVGDIAPDFTLEDQDGRKHTLSAERGKRPVVLVFYRGYW